jgi:hypothetical protein
MSSWYFLPIYFQAVRGASPTRSGVLLMPIVVVQAIAGLAAGAISYRFGSTRSLIWAGMTLTTLGFGLFISLDASTSLAQTVVIEVVAALGVGINFQAPLLAYQSVVGQEDIAVATALFGFVRSLSTSISVVMGGIVFQNGMSLQRTDLSSSLGVQLARNFSATTAATNVLTVGTLPLYQQKIVKGAYVHSLKDMWAMYAVMGGVGLAAAFFVTKQAPVETSPAVGGERSTMELQQS